MNEHEKKAVKHVTGIHSNAHGTLNAKQRNAMPKSEFGEPGQRKYPMPDKSHAANAKARATQQFNKGNLSASARAQIDAKANKILKK